MCGLQDRLDPIDWATYEHHLWANVKRHYQRCLVLYGALTQLQRVHPHQVRRAHGEGEGGRTVALAWAQQALCEGGHA